MATCFLQPVATEQCPVIDRYEARRSHRQRLAQIARAAMEEPALIPGGRRQARVEAFLRDRKVLAHLAYERQPDVSPEAIHEAIAGIDLFAPCLEAVPWFVAAKHGSRPRSICDLGPEQRLRHIAIKHVLEAQLPPSRSFYDLRGTGPAKAVLAITKAVEQFGPYVLSADVANCFASINPDAIYELGVLPPEVIRYALDYRHLPLTRRATHAPPGIIYSKAHNNNLIDNVEPTVPTGILVGSPASNALLRHLLSATVSAIGLEERVFVYVDNFYVIASTPEICGHIQESLSRHLAGSPAGPLRLGYSSINHVENGFDVLGYHLFRAGEGAAVGRTLNDKNLHRLEYQISGYLRALGRRPRFCSALRKAADVLSRYPAVDCIFRDEVMQQFAWRAW